MRGPMTDLSQTSGWGAAQATTKDKTLWRNIVIVGLRPTVDEEDKMMIDVLWPLLYTR